jgi:hypothetical protein
MDLEKVGEEIGTEVEGVRNRLSFLAHNPTPGYVALEEQEKAGALRRDESLHGGVPRTAVARPCAGAHGRLHTCAVARWQAAETAPPAELQITRRRRAALRRARQRRHALPSRAPG